MYLIIGRSEQKTLLFLNKAFIVKNLADAQMHAPLMPLLYVMMYSMDGLEVL